MFVDVDDIKDSTCLEILSPRLGAIIAALKYARNPDEHKEMFRRILGRFGNRPYDTKTLELFASIDVYLHCWLSENFKEVLNMDFVRPPYKTIADAEREEREALEKEVAETKEALAAKDARIAELEAALKAQISAMAAK